MKIIAVTLFILINVLNSISNRLKRDEFFSWVNRNRFLLLKINAPLLLQKIHLCKKSKLAIKIGNILEFAS